MAAVQQTRDSFADFLLRVSERAVSVADWNRYTVTHYADAATETARRELVRACLELSQCSACVVPIGLEPVALGLREQLLELP